MNIISIALIIELDPSGGCGGLFPTHVISIIAMDVIFTKEC